MHCLLNTEQQTDTETMQMVNTLKRLTAKNSDVPTQKLVETNNRVKRERMLGEHSAGGQNTDSKNHDGAYCEYMMRSKLVGLNLP